VDDAVPGTPRARAALGDVARAAALPHGYTLTVWAASMALIARHGLPGPVDVALFVAGARAAYALLRRGDGGRVDAAAPDHGGTMTQSAALALVLGAALACAQLPGWTAWAPASFVATLAYFTTIALASRAAPRGPPRARAPHPPTDEQEEEHRV
jgi:hypothetical protein